MAFEYIAPTVIQSSALPLRTLFLITKSLKIEGIENLNYDEAPYIFAANHIGELDSVMIAMSMPLLSPFRPLYFVSKEKDHYDVSDFGWRTYFYGGAFFKILGAFPAKKGLKCYETSLKDHINLLETGKSILIFPEGKWRTGEKLEAKGGVSYLVERTNCKVIPTFIEGLETLSWSNFLVGNVNIRIVFGKPISKEELNETERDYKMGAEYIMKKVDELK